MASSTAARPALSDAEFEELVALMKDSDSVELKLTVPESDQRSAIGALGMDPLEAQIRQVFFFDTPDLALDKHGIVVRGRRMQKKGDDSVVKLRPSSLPSFRTTFGARRGSASRSTRCRAGSSAREP
jgi:hypothetical protein